LLSEIQPRKLVFVDKGDMQNLCPKFWGILLCLPQTWRIDVITLSSLPMLTELGWLSLVFQAQFERFVFIQIIDHFLITKIMQYKEGIKGLCNNESLNGMYYAQNMKRPEPPTESVSLLSYTCIWNMQRHLIYLCFCMWIGNQGQDTAPKYWQQRPVLLLKSKLLKICSKINYRVFKNTLFYAFISRCSSKTNWRIPVR
jgi:hypothetical protein